MSEGGREGGREGGKGGREGGRERESEGGREGDVSIDRQPIYNLYVHNSCTCVCSVMLAIIVLTFPLSTYMYIIRSSNHNSLSCKQQICLEV